MIRLPAFLANLLAASAVLYIGAGAAVLTGSWFPLKLAFWSSWGWSSVALFAWLLPPPRLR